MHHNSHTEDIHCSLVDRLLLIIGDDFGGHKAGCSTFGEDDGLLMLIGSQSIVHNFESLVAVALIQTVLVLKEDVLRLDVAVHDVLGLHVLNPLEDLLDDAVDLLRFELFVLPAILDLFVESYALEELEHDVEFVAILEHLEKTHQVVVFQVAQYFQLVEY
jgi:hypothetical protein